MVAVQHIEGYTGRTQKDTQDHTGGNETMVAYRTQAFPE
jgi:hypothetical protein